MRAPSIFSVLTSVFIVSNVYGCPQEIPKGVSSDTVGQDMVINGLPMSVQQLSTKEKPAALLERVAKEWTNAKFDVKRSDAGQWMIISARSEKCLTTLQLIERNGSFGYFAVSQPDRSQTLVSRRLGIELPNGIDINSSVSTVDGGRPGYTIGFSTLRSVDDLNSYFMSSLNDVGWQSLSSHEVRRPTEKARARIVTGQKGRERISIVIWDKSATQVVLNLSEAL